MKGVIKDIFTGRGVIEDFHQCYQQLSCQPNLEPRASQLFPTGEVEEVEVKGHGKKGEEEIKILKKLVYEWVIYFDAFPMPDKTKPKQTNVTPTLQM